MMTLHDLFDFVQKHDGDITIGHIPDTSMMKIRLVKYTQDGPAIKFGAAWLDSNMREMLEHLDFLLPEWYDRMVFQIDNSKRIRRHEDVKD